MTPIGAGRSALALLVSLGWCSSVSAEEVRSTEWVDGIAWPYTYSVELHEHPLLVVVEQDGIDLRVAVSGGASVNTPLGRIGPEFVYVAPGEAPTLAVTQMYSATGRGRFRLTFVTLDEAPLQELGRALFDAGKEFDSRESSTQTKACSSYRTGAGIAGLGEQWRSLAQVLVAGCDLAIGGRMSATELDSVVESYSFLSILPHHLPWLRAQQLSFALQYRAMAAQFEIALQRAQRALVDSPERELGTRHDIAEIQADL